MFQKKCKNCGEKVEKEFMFCPYCGFDVERERKERDYGLLGKDDNSLLNNAGFGLRMPFGFNTLFNSLLKEVDKQFKEIDRQIGKEEKQKERLKPEVRSNGLSISVSMGNGKKPEIRIGGFGPEFENLRRGAEKEREIKTMPQVSITEEKAKRLASLPRKEAETSMKRLGNKVIYEINMPGVENLKEVIINKLENSIEIKAFSKDKVYFKLIPLKLPILGYNLREGKLVLELGARS